MSADVLAVVAPALLSGGAVGAGVSLYTARKKVPAEVDSIVVSGAETAVVALEKTLAAETRRADRAESRVAERDAELARKDERIAALEARLDRLQEALDEARNELHSIITGEK